MNNRREWDQSLFESLTSNRLSRNRYFEQFNNEWFRAVHRRYRVVESLRHDARRLSEVPDSNCWIRPEGDGLLFHLQSPRLSYKRVVALQSYEWEWLGRQEEIRSLLHADPRTPRVRG